MPHSIFLAFGEVVCEQMHVRGAGPVFLPMRRARQKSIRWSRRLRRRPTAYMAQVKQACVPAGGQRGGRGEGQGRPASTRQRVKAERNGDPPRDVCRPRRLPPRLHRRDNDAGGPRVPQSKRYGPAAVAFGVCAILSRTAFGVIGHFGGARLGDGEAHHLGAPHGMGRHARGHR